MPSLNRRFAGPELMDDGALAPEALAACLADLERLNRMTGAYVTTLAWLDRLFKASRSTVPLVIVDAGCGHGDMLRRIGGLAARRGVRVELVGIDMSPHATAAAGAATPKTLRIRWLTGDALDLLRQGRWDVILSSLLTHHLDNASVVRLLQLMDRHSRLGWLTTDLQRHIVPYWAARMLPPLLGMHPIVRHDAAVSVARAFTRADWRHLLTEAGLDEPGVRLIWRFPFRWVIDRMHVPCR
jgi:2-polyprenyl-3-methyl-5-hydroxy-6-metoxy-1,4-benzoquinol methylase